MLSIETHLKLNNIWYIKLFLLDNTKNMKKINKHGCIICISLVAITTLLLYSVLNQFKRTFPKSEDILPDVSKFLPSDNRRNIFFLETSRNDGKIVIKARQACAVESAALMNPNMNVNLLYVSPGVIKHENTESDRILEAVRTYPNINILHFDIETVILGTPIQEFWLSGKLKKSNYPMAHTSDTLRLLTLWKFGGIYLDLDVIIVKSLELFPENFAGAESDRFIANGVMGFSRVGKGHDYVTAYMKDISKNFDGTKWSYNGPSLLTRIIASRCPELTVQEMIQAGLCEEFTIFPTSSFYLIPWMNWKWFFEKYQKEIIEIGVRNKSFMIHVWNKLSYNRTINKEDIDVPYLHFAKSFCPKVFAQVDKVF